MPSWRKVRRSVPNATGAKRVGRGRASRPTLETLEGRVVMTVTTALDPSFGSFYGQRGGLVYGPTSSDTTQVNLNRPSAVAVQADGKIVQVGTTQLTRSNSSGPTFLLVSRLNVDGSPDQTFGTFGTFTVPTPNTTSVATAGPREVSLQADGSILFTATFLDGTYASQNPFRTAVIKMTSAGTLDTSFGTGGEVLVPAAADAAFGQLIVQPGGELLVASDRSNGTADLNSTYSFTLTRFSAAGVLDSSFGTDGTVVITPPQSSAPGAISQVDRFNAEPLPGGQVLLVGSTTTSPNIQTSLKVSNILARVNVDGTLDAGFGTGGYATFRPGSGHLFINSVAAQPDGKVLLAGQDFSSNSIQFLARILPDGSVDPTVSPTLAGPVDAIAVATDGTITLVGTKTRPITLRALNLPSFVQRIRPDGSPDTTFGTRGQTFFRSYPASYPFSGPIFTSFAALALTPSGSVVVASVATDSTYGSVQPVLARLLPIAVSPTPGDYDGDGTSDPAALLPNGQFVYRTAAGDTTLDLFRGASNQPTLPAAGDYDGDGITDPAAYLTGQARLNYNGTANHPNGFVTFGASGSGQTIPAPGDYNGDGKTDVAAYLPSLGEFAIRTDTIRNPGDVFVPFGIPGAGHTIPAPGDYDGDGKTDIAAYLPSYGVLAYRPSSGGPDVLTSFGPTGDRATIPAPGDYDGDGKTDIAVYLPSYGVLAYRPSSGGPDVLTQFGGAGVGTSIPAPGDYDGDGRTDIAVYLPQLAIFAYRPSSGGNDVLLSFGVPGTGKTVPAASIPYAQPPTVSGLAMLAGSSPATGDLPLTDDILAAIAGKTKAKTRA